MSEGNSIGGGGGGGGLGRLLLTSAGGAGGIDGTDGAELLDEFVLDVVGVADAFEAGWLQLL